MSTGGTAMDPSTFKGVRPLALMYHDVGIASGFPGPAADLYKLDLEDFRLHLDAIGRERRAVSTVEAPGPAPLLLTFDDGGASAHDPIAGELERRGWRGHFFVTTDYIGQRGFLTADQIVDLRRRGHVIGSHSCSHPLRISHCAWDDIVREWAVSVRVLSEILDEPVWTASVPGGFYSAEVARAAAQAGIRVLFTSEPTSRAHRIDGCVVLGRYFVQRHTPPAVAAGFASGRLLPCVRQAVMWELKKAAKAAGGGFWFRFRARMLAR